MTRKVWKYPLRHADAQSIQAPRLIKPLYVAVQRGVPCMWCEVDDASPMMLHNVYTYGTDHPLNHPPQAYYIGSYQYEEHQLVFHTYFLSGEEIYRQKAQAQDTLNTLQATFSLKDYPQEYPDQDPPEAA